MVAFTTLFHFLASFSVIVVATDPRIFQRKGESLMKRNDINRIHIRAPEQCQPFRTDFKTPQDISSSFVGVSPSNSYESSEWGLHMFLRRPSGVQRNGNVNNVLGEGATLNSTFTMLYGKVTFRVQAPPIPGVVTAAILIADQSDEIDVELLGSDSSRFQTNVFAPSRRDRGTLYDTLGQVHTIGHAGHITGWNNYTIDWTEDRIEWSVNNRVVRTLTPDQTVVGGVQHFPSHPSRIQLGIWDASNPAGTSEWAGGPIDWQNAPSTITATVKEVTVECH